MLSAVLLQAFHYVRGGDLLGHKDFILFRYYASIASLRMQAPVDPIIDDVEVQIVQGCGRGLGNHTILIRRRIRDHDAVCFDYFWIDRKVDWVNTAFTSAVEHWMVFREAQNDILVDTILFVAR
jgi:hypothetical protein